MILREKRAKIPNDKVAASDEVDCAIRILQDKLIIIDLYEGGYDEFYYYTCSPRAFVENELYIFNPEKNPATIPFRLYSYQADFLDRLYNKYINGENVLDEKSRQMGLSWLYMAFYLWGLKTRMDFSAYVMSYKERLVDDGGSENTVNSLLGKLRFMYTHLREELQGDLTFKHLSVSNSKTGAYVIGENANSNAGRGGTYKIGLWDETASTPKSEVIFPAFHQACRCRCYNSTVRGKGNVFSRLRHDPDSTVEVVTFHWTAHPEYSEGLELDENSKPTSPWYKLQCRDLTVSQVAHELDIDYEASVEGRIYYKFQKAVHVRSIDFNPEWKENSIIAWDLGVSDETFGTVMQLDNQGDIGIVDEIVGTDEEIRFYISLICGVEPPEVKFLTYEKRKVYQTFLERSRKYGYVDLINIAGPDATQRSITSKASVRQQFMNAASLGIDPTTRRTTDRRFKNLRMIPLTGFKIMDRVVEMRKVMDPVRNHFVVAERCVNTIERLFNYKWTTTVEGMNRETPDHNWASHGADSVGYGVLWFKRRKAILKKPDIYGQRHSKGRPGIIATMNVGMKR